MSMPEQEFVFSATDPIMHCLAELSFYPENQNLAKALDREEIASIHRAIMNNPELDDLWVNHQLDWLLNEDIPIRLAHLMARTTFIKFAGIEVKYVLTHDDLKPTL